MTDRPARRRMAGTTTLVVVVVLPPMLVGSLASRIAHDFPLDPGRLGVALASCYAVTCVLSPVGGRLVDRIGADAALRIAGAMAALGLLGIAASSRFDHLVLALAFIGVPNALTQPASNLMLSRVEGPRLRALSFGLVQASIPAAGLVAGSVLAVATYATSWRVSVLFLAGIGLGAQLVLPRGPRHVRSSAVKGRLRRSHAARVEQERAGGLPLMAALVVIGCLASASATALPSFAATSGLAIGVAPWLVAVCQVAGSLTSIVVRVVAPVATSRATLYGRLLTVAVLQTVGLTAMLAMSTGTHAGFVLGGIAAFGFGWGWNGLFNLIVALARPVSIAGATGLTQAGVFLGGAVGPLAFATVAHDGAYGVAWIAMAATMGVAAITAGCAAHLTQQTPVHPHREAVPT
jgi:predicted MFS family arabinose efflux permease